MLQTSPLIIPTTPPTTTAGGFLHSRPGLSNSRGSLTQHLSPDHSPGGQDRGINNDANGASVDLDLGNWILEQPLARDPSIWQGYHKLTKKPAMVKIIPQDLQVYPDWTVESRKLTLQLIDHPNISRLYEFRATAKAHFIFAEIAAYGTLEEHLKAVRSSPGYTPALLENQVRAYIEQILMALVYCHELGVYQQQMKLSDVLLEDENTVKIASFGMCLLSVLNCTSHQEDEDQHYALPHPPPNPQLGQEFPRASKLLPHYTSPEGLHGQLHGGAPAEVWSLGVILFQLLTGRLPFDEPDEEALTNKIQWGYFKMRNSDQLSAPAEDLLRRMLDPDAKTRISLDAVISHEWIDMPSAALCATQTNNADLCGIMQYSPRNASIDLHKDFDATRIAALEFSAALAARHTYAMIARTRQLCLGPSNLDLRIVGHLQKLYPKAALSTIVQRLFKDQNNSEKGFYCLLRDHYSSVDSPTLLSPATKLVKETTNQCHSPPHCQVLEKTPPQGDPRDTFRGTQVSPSPSPRKDSRLKQKSIVYSPKETENDNNDHIAQFTTMIEQAFKPATPPKMSLDSLVLIEKSVITTPPPRPLPHQFISFSPSRISSTPSPSPAKPQLNPSPMNRTTPVIDKFSKEIEYRLRFDDTEWETEIDFDLPFLKRDQKSKTINNNPNRSASPGKKNIMGRRLPKVRFFRTRDLDSSPTKKSTNSPSQKSAQVQPKLRHEGRIFGVKKSIDSELGQGLCSSSKSNLSTSTSTSMSTSASLSSISSMSSVYLRDSVISINISFSSFESI